MLQEIINTKDIDFTNFRELHKYAKYLNYEDYNEIINILNNKFDKSLYTEQQKTLGIIGLQPFVRGKHKGASKYIHGIYHVEKVFLYCYIMVKKYNDEHEDKIPTDLADALYYAALYHDVGRVDNSESNEHGLNAAKIFNKLFSDRPDFKGNEEKMFLVEALMTIHSENYEIEDDNDNNIDRVIQTVLYEHVDEWNDTSKVKKYADKYFKLLCDILKDADALDRKRFGEWQRESLNEAYLRTIYSKDLVHFADDLNKLYYKVMQSKFLEPDFSYMKTSDCFHSIGFDFFKIKSILVNGVLSQEELMKKSIMVPRNFPGGNFDRWISVVDPVFYPDFVQKKESDNNENSKSLDDDCDPSKNETFASELFTQRGITFYCHNVYLFAPEEDKDRALELGLPWNKSNYVDEKYVYQKIAPSNILGLFIPFECINWDIKKLWYIYESTNMDIVRSRVEYYKRYTEVLNGDSRVDTLNKLLDEYEILNINELYKTNGQCNSEAYFKESEKIMVLVNKIIGELVFEYYSKKLNTKVFGIKDVVEYEVSNIKSIDFEITNLNQINCNELLFLINSKEEKKKTL